MDQSEFIYTPETAILYALGIGEQEDLKYLYECYDGFSFYPTYCILPCIKALIDFDTHQQHLAKLKIPFDVSRLLHGEQFIEFFSPLPQNENKFLTKQPHLVELLDKGSAGTLVITEQNTYTQTGKLLCRNQTCCMIVGAGGWGGPRQSENPMVEQIVKPPSEQPADKVVEQMTLVNQAALYRLSGDRNPLHIDPMFALAGGYNRPILHGLCSLGFAVRHIMQTYPEEQVQRVKARFSGVIYPGETIVTSMWRREARVHFQCHVKETDKIIVTGAYLDLAKQ